MGSLLVIAPQVKSVVGAASEASPLTQTIPRIVSSEPPAWTMLKVSLPVPPLSSVTLPVAVARTVMTSAPPAALTRRLLLVPVALIVIVSTAALPLIVVVVEAHVVVTLIVLAPVPALRLTVSTVVKVMSAMPVRWSRVAVSV